VSLARRLTSASLSNLAVWVFNHVRVDVRSVRDLPVPVGDSTWIMLGLMLAE
jgi:hypothetical protein